MVVPPTAVTQGSIGGPPDMRGAIRHAPLGAVVHRAYQEGEGVRGGGGGHLKRQAHGFELRCAPRSLGRIPAYRDDRWRRLRPDGHRRGLDGFDPSRLGPGHEIDGNGGADRDGRGGVDVQDDLAVPAVGAGWGAGRVGCAEDRDRRVEHLDVGQRRVQPGHEQVGIRRVAGGVGHVAAAEFEDADRLGGDGRRDGGKAIEACDLGRRDRRDGHARSAASKRHAAVVQAEYRRHQVDNVVRQVNRPVMAVIGLVRSSRTSRARRRRHDRSARPCRLLRSCGVAG